MVDNEHSCWASFRAAGVGAAGSLDVPEESSELECAIKYNMETNRRYVPTRPGQVARVCAAA